MMIALYIILSLILILTAVYIFVLVRPRGRAPQDLRLLTDYAHRGLHADGIPENSLAAFERAVKQGYGIELDVQLSCDGEVMVFHDYTLKRMTGESGKLSDYTADELSKMHLNGTEQTIPRLSDVLMLVDGRVPLLVELKGESGDTTLCEPLCRLLESYSGGYCIESFNPILLGKMAKLMPEIYRGILYTNLIKEKKKISIINILLTLMAANVIAKPDFVAYNENFRSSFAVGICTRFYRAGKASWTLKTDESYRAAKDYKEIAIFEAITPK